MAKKTVIRRLFKYLPVSIEAVRATEIDERTDRGETLTEQDWLDAEYIDKGTAAAPVIEEAPAAPEPAPDPQPLPEPAPAPQPEPAPAPAPEPAKAAPKAKRAAAATEAKPVASSADDWYSGFDAARQAPPPQPIEDAPF